MPLARIYLYFCISCVTVHFMLLITCQYIVHLPEVMVRPQAHVNQSDIIKPLSTVILSANFNMSAETRYGHAVTLTVHY